MAPISAEEREKGIGIKETKEEDEYDMLWGSEGDDSSSDFEPDKDARARKPKRTSKSGAPLQFGHVLGAPLASRYSCESLEKLITDSLIDLEPEYQRGVVWPKDKQSAIIDSIFRHCYIPPVLFSIHHITNEEGEEEEIKICVDGKQRLSSIWNFMNNMIPLREPNTGRAFWYKEDLTKANCFTDAQRRRFAREQMNAVEFQNLSEDEERDMFQRVQMGVTLSPAEKLAANLGPWADFFRELSKRYIENDSANLRHVIKTDRGKDWLFMGQITFNLLHIASPKAMPSVNGVNAFVKKQGNNPPSATQRNRVITTLNRFTALANDPKHNLPLLPEKSLGRAPKPISPVEFIYIPLLIFHFPHADNALLSKLIQGLKDAVRSVHKDVMINTKNIATIREYLSGVIAQSKSSNGLGPNNVASRKRPREDFYEY